MFGTIAAESQRLINETYSAFVQGFMPSLGRPDVDVLDGLTTAIIVDQERMGANSRSTVGTATDANAMLRILFSRLGKPHIGSAAGVLVQHPVGRPAAARIDVEPADGSIEKRDSFEALGGMCPRCEGMGTVNDIDLDAALRRRPSRSTRAPSRSPATRADGWGVRIFTESGFVDRRQADPRLHRAGAARLPLQGAHQGQGRRAST